MSETKKADTKAQRHPERPDGVWPPVATMRTAADRVTVGGALTAGYADENGLDAEQRVELEVKRAEIQRETEKAADEIARSGDVSVGQTNLTPLNPTAEIPAAAGARARKAAK